MKYTVAVRYTGRIEYQVDAESEAEALEAASELAQNEDDFNQMEDVDWGATVIGREG